MIHGGHRLKIYTRVEHVLVALATLFLPAIFLLIYGSFAKSEALVLASGLGISFARLLVGYAISLFVGLAIALLIGTNKAGEWLMPVFDVLQNVPSFALIPVFALLLGYSNTMVVVFAATSIVWPILFYALSALRTAHREWDEAATVFGAVGWRRVWNYHLPLVFPAVVTGSIVGISIGWEAVIGLEIIGFHTGVGVFLDAASKQGDQTALFLGIVAILFLVVTINKLIWSPLLKHARLYAE